MDAQLQVHPFEDVADRLWREEGLLRDLPVAESACGQVGDLALGPGQLRGSVWAAPDTPELLARALGPDRRAESLEDRERGLQRLVRESLLLPTAVQLTFGQQGPRALEWHRQAVVGA